MSNKVKEVVYQMMERYAIEYKLDHGYRIHEQELLFHIFHKCEHQDALLYYNLSLLELMQLLIRLHANGLIILATENPPT